MTYYDFHKPEQNQNFQLILTSKVPIKREILSKKAYRQVGIYYWT